MKKRIKGLSKEKRAAGLIVIGLLLIGATAILSSTFITANEDVYEPTVTSNYQPEDETLAETDTEEVEEAPAPEPTPEPASQWPVNLTMAQAADIQVVVNKKHKLPSTYAPSLVTVAGGQMRQEAATAMQNMLNAASSAGASMNIISSYRSYQTQVSTYQYWVDTQGQAQADRESARPGHSEHQTGLTADMGNPDGSCRLLACFGSGTAGTWLKNNAHKYGFIIRYPEGKEALTGYIYEPWHVRYLGVDVATAVKQSGQTLDQYYGVEAGGY